MEKQSISEETSSASSFTSEGTPTITSSLRARGMPNMNSSYNNNEEESTLSTSLNARSYDNRIRAGRDPRQHHRSVSPDSVVVSLTEERNQSIARLQNNDVIVCCLHGRPCSIGRATASDDSKCDTQYEEISIEKLLESPPASFTTHRRHVSSKHNSSSKPAVRRRHYPSHMSTDATTTSSLRNGVYENIEGLNKLSAPKIPVHTYDDTITSHETSKVIRRCRPAGITLKDFYLGAMKKRDAEKLVKKNTFFRLYHRVPSGAAVDIDALRDQITLYIVYKTSKGDYCHFPIQRSRGEAVMGSKSKKYYYIDCGEGEELMRFNSLDALVNYYWVYVKFNEHDSGVEHFPVPSKSKARQLRTIGNDNDDGEVLQYKSRKHGNERMRENYY